MGMDLQLKKQCDEEVNGSYRNGQNKLSSIYINLTTCWWLIYVSCSWDIGIT